ncbi:TauD/TfdA family dioxygenase [Siccirubricoccus phaeus]|uniref:TauD/TfdA family dioxygenase n=1 Tax=Siccirubricoccus phaeus TaxID=2595053 RepID=UPI0011F0E867|nr:TauD/TfdA family dioxygenase [Siccirubricoccus phaeus]
MTPPPRLTPQAGPSVWSGAALTPADWMLPVGAELAAALAEPDPAAKLAPLLGPVAERLEHGRGFVLLRGLPIEKLPAPEAALLALGQALGTPLPQDAAGALVGRLAGPGAGVEAGGPPRFHADPADAVALLCLQQAREGGVVTLVSAPALHNALMKADRAALAVLHQPFPHLGAETPLSLPVFSTASGAFVGRYDRDSMLETALDEAQLAALAALDEAAAAPGQALTIPLHAGDVLLHNPHLVWKRVAAGAVAAPEAARQLLRLWLALPGSRALPESFRQVFGETAAGAPRGGVATPPGLVGG